MLNLYVETRAPIAAEQVIQLLENTEGVEVFQALDFPTQVLMLVVKARNGWSYS